ncbi:MAG: serine hydrolase [Ruminococcus sp.]|nr:serine hydrolase [Ruminococcus sp.]
MLRKKLFAVLLMTLICGVFAFSASADSSDERFDLLSKQEAVVSASSGLVAPYNFLNYNSSYEGIALRWTMMSGISGYELQVWNIKGEHWDPLTKISAARNVYVHTGLPSGTTMKYRIRTYKTSGGTTTYSPWKAALASTDPYMIVKYIEYGASTSGYSIKWNAVRGADKYIVSKYNPNTGRYDRLAVQASNEYTIRGLEAGSHQCFAVQPIKIRDWSRFVFYGKTTVFKPSVLCDRVQGVTTNVRLGRATVRWNKVRNANAYQIYYNNPDGSGVTLIDEVSYSINSINTTKIPANKRLYVKVRAVSITPDVKVSGQCSPWVRTRVFNNKTYNGIIYDYDNSSAVTLTNGQGYSIPGDLKNNLSYQLNCLGGTCSFILLDLDSGALVGSNAKTYMETASTVKMPYMLYCLKQMEDGSPSMDTMLTYDRSDYSSGSSYIHNFSFGSKFSIKDCMQYIFDYSDNCGYYMLQDYFGLEGYNNYIASLGCRTTVNWQNRWGWVSAADSAKEWIQMYYYMYNGRYANFIRHGFATSTASNFRIGLNGRYTVYSKCGWTDNLHHDTTIVEAEHPYVLICFTDRVSAYRLQQLAKAADAIHRDMWAYYDATS